MIRPSPIRRFWEGFRAGRARIEAIRARESEEIVAHAAAAGALKALVSNDHHPAPAFPPESARLAEMRANYEKLVEFPFRLVRAAMEPLATNAPANVVMITSNRAKLNRAKLPLAGRDFVRASVPVGRLGDLAEIGELILFLATSRARFLTGAVVDFSGGWPFGPPPPQA